MFFPKGSILFPSGSGKVGAMNPTSPLSSRENFLRMMKGDRPDWVPFDLPTTPPVLDMIEARKGTRDAALAFDTDFWGCEVSLPGDPARWRAAFEALGFSVPQNAEITATGITHVPPPAGSTQKAYHFREMLHPLAGVEEVSQLEQLPWPDLTDPAAENGLAEQVQKIHAAGKVALASMECTAFESAWYLRGMETLFSDLIEENGVSDWLLDWFTRYSCRKAWLAARAGVDVIGLGDDVGTQRGMMMSVSFWREHLKPRLKTVIDTIRKTQTRPLYIRYHSDGDVRDIVDDLAEIGVDILNPVQPECMPLAEVIPAHRHHLAFWGMVGTQTTMPFGTPDDVRAIVAQCEGFARDGARLIIAPTHVLEPEVPWENIEALADAVHAISLR